MERGVSRMVSSIYQWRHTREQTIQPSPKALADLARRRAMPDTRDNTGRLLGDPEPGRSALDQKLACERVATESGEEPDV